MSIFLTRNSPYFAGVMTRPATEPKVRKPRAKKQAAPISTVVAIPDTIKSRPCVRVVVADVVTGEHQKTLGKPIFVDAVSANSQARHINRTLASLGTINETNIILALLSVL